VKHMNFKIIEQHKDINLIVLNNDLPIRYFGGKVLIDNLEATARLALGWGNALLIKEKGDYVGKELIIFY